MADSQLHPQLPLFKWVEEKYDTLAEDMITFKKGKPVPIIESRNFLPCELTIDLNEECCSIDTSIWKKFTRNGSSMIELNKMENAPLAHYVISYLNGSHFIKYLEHLTQIKNLIPDPHLIGAGYSRRFEGDSLKIHTDFNWNEELQLHRAVSLIIYLNPDWKSRWGGRLKFYDENREKVQFEASSDLGYHGYEDPIDCPNNHLEVQSRNTLRLFYYVSKSKHDKNDPPHRSLYWYDPETKKPFDKKEIK